MQKQRNHQRGMMITTTLRREMPSRPADLGGALTLSWMGLGLSLMAGVAVIGGWRGVLGLWLTSALALGAILLRDSIADHP